jgi:uncharacterized membrane protein YcaP (DUF421 family)
MEKIFFESWESIARTLLMTSLSYVTMVILLRISGKRTLAKMNAFDFVVTIALGSSLATVALNKSVLWLMESQQLGYIYLHNLFYLAYNTHSMDERTHDQFVYITFL